MIKFFQDMPKVELHAHLNGSLSTQSIRELALNVYGEDSKEFHEMCDRFVTFKYGANLDECFQKFEFVHQLTDTRAGLQYATELVIRDFALDNVMYAELRTTPKSRGDMTRRDYLEAVLESIKKLRNEYKIVVKLLPSIDRSQPVVEAEEIVALTLEFAKREPNIIVGLDFSGNPNRGKFCDFMPALQLVRSSGLKLAMHCAEIENPVELEEMIKLGMSRCGHGSFLTPAGFAHMKAMNIPIECCLTSNVKSGTVASYEAHHLKQLLENGAAKVLCTDDCGVFNTTLSNEFKLASEVFGLTQTQCIDLTREAIHYSFATPEEKLNMKLTLYHFAKNFYSC